MTNHDCPSCGQTIPDPPVAADPVLFAKHAIFKEADPSLQKLMLSVIDYVDAKVKEKAWWKNKKSKDRLKYVEDALCVIADKGTRENDVGGLGRYAQGVLDRLPKE